MLALSLELARHQLGDRLVPLPKSLAAPLGVLALIAFASEGIWRLARHISVIAHEGGHAVAGSSMGRRVSGVKLNRDATGETAIRGPSGGLGTTITAFAGYLGPSLFGLGAATLIALDHIQAVLWLAIIFLAIMLLFARNFFGVISVLLNGGLLFIILRFGSAGVQTIAAYGLSWFLLLSGVRFAFTHGSGAADAGILREITRVPRAVWATLWLVITVAALWVGGRLLVGQVV